MSKFLTVQEFATQVGRPAVTVRRLCAAGKVRSVRLGRAWMIPSDEADRLLVAANESIARETAA